MHSLEKLLSTVNFNLHLRKRETLVKEKQLKTTAVTNLDAIYYLYLMTLV